ncbi:histone acetyltransferase type b catalytic subunit [Anaeramoeba flamelloides]|uniref:histone acetyltransferase n=1 Tax=Anaeramoeba flamelloides TaxID=1746091 RepID=A0ABQ8X150_9EUKA|nr:histone acetyltransferase type b catalytic subunit [Anaeramoeba flamelloides]
MNNFRQPPLFLNHLPGCVQLIFPPNEKPITPKYTHQFFGPTSTIFGYTQLRIILRYTPSLKHCFYKLTAESMLPFTDQTDHSRANLKKMLKQYFAPNSFLTTEKSYNSKEINEISNPIFKAPGKILEHFTDLKDRKFIISHSRLKDLNTQSYFKKIQHVSLWFVDGISLINVEDPNWHVFFLFEKVTANIEPNVSNDKQNVNNEKEKEKEKEKEIQMEIEQEQEKEQKKEYLVLAGFVTVYRFSLSSEEQKMRISHFLLLPHYDDSSLKLKLLRTLNKYILTKPKVIEFNVEDPLMDLQLLRNAIDASRVIHYQTKKSREPTKEDLLEIRKLYKMNLRQTRIALEIFYLLISGTENQNGSQKIEIARKLMKNRLNQEFDEKMILNMNNRIKFEEKNHLQAIELIKSWKN